MRYLTQLTNPWCHSMKPPWVPQTQVTWPFSNSQLLIYCPRDLQGNLGGWIWEHIKQAPTWMWQRILRQQTYNTRRKTFWTAMTISKYAHLTWLSLTSAHILTKDIRKKRPRLAGSLEVRKLLVNLREKRRKLSKMQWISSILMISSKTIPHTKCCKKRDPWFLPRMVRDSTVSMLAPLTTSFFATGNVRNVELSFTFTLRPTSWSCWTVIHAKERPSVSFWRQHHRRKCPPVPALPGEPLRASLFGVLRSPTSNSTTWMK